MPFFDAWAILFRFVWIGGKANETTTKTKKKGSKRVKKKKLCLTTQWMPTMWPISCKRVWNAHTQKMKVEPNDGVKENDSKYTLFWMYEEKMHLEKIINNFLFC